MMTAWNHLPNAVHIDRVLVSLKAHPEVWEANAAVARVAWYAASREAWQAAGYSARTAARDAAREAAWGAAGDRAGSVSGAALDAIAALIAWDHSAKFLDMTSNELKMWQKLSEDPACILLLPAVMAFEQIKELEFA